MAEKIDEIKTQIDSQKEGLQDVVSDKKTRLTRKLLKDSGVQTERLEENRKGSFRCWKEN